MMLSFTMSAAAQSGGNHPPVISGNPSTTATVGERYVFRPTASDRDGDRLRFGISNRPRWATFDSDTGRLVGTPRSGDRGTYTDIRIRVSDGVATRSLDPFRIVVGAGGQNRAPVISGTPSTSIAEGQAYAFRPTASDPDGDALTFSVSNRPPWATFSSSTGRLSGTPGTGTVGTYSDIRIRVSDGVAQAALPAFSINVQQIAAGSVTLAWRAPTTRVDGSALRNLAGYRVKFGNAAGSYPNTITLNNPGITSYSVQNLAPGRWYFVIAAFDSSGYSSADTSPVSTLID
jgi:Putative Ig domain